VRVRENKIGGSAKMNNLPPKRVASSMLWFDAADTDTIRARGSYVLSWASKASTPATLRPPGGGDDLVMGVVPGLPQSAWRNAVVSADGATVCLFTDYGGEAYLSKDYGATFRTIPELRDPAHPVMYMECAMSSDGRVIIVCSFDGPLWVSRDGGSAWSSFNLVAIPLYEWCSVSNDGRFCLVTAQGEGVFASNDHGATWTRASVGTPETELGFVYVSPTGDNQYIAFYNGPLAISSDRGKSFVPHPDMVRGNWYDLSVQKVTELTPACQVIIESPGWLWVTRDSGGRWTPALIDRRRRWCASGVSADASVVCALEENGLSYISRDKGRSFQTLLDDVPRPWSGLAVFVDGAILLCGTGVASRFTTDRGLSWKDIGSFNVQEDVTLSGFATSWDARTVVLAERNGSAFVRDDPSMPTFGDAPRGAAPVKLSATPLRLELAVAGSVRASPATIIASARVGQDNAGGFLSGANDIVLSPFVSGRTVFGCDTPMEVTRTPVRGGSWCVVAMTISQDLCQLFINGKLISVQPVGVRAATSIEPLWIGAEGFLGEVGEIFMFGSDDLPVDGSGDWDRLHYYLGRKWNVPAALPFVPGMGSDPHVKTYRGGTYDIIKAGWYTLVAMQPHFSITAKVSPVKGALYIESAIIQNGPKEVKVTMKSRSLKWGQRGARFEDGAYDLAEGGHCNVKWDIQPVSPQRLVKVVSGVNPKLGRFCVRIDFQLRYVTPWFADFSDWDSCTGVLASEGSSSRKAAGRGVIAREHKPLVRNERQMSATPRT
jgi:photosystem II stability/assembly factor-like uncharacterized protein